MSGKIKILAVEDEPEIVESFEFMFTKMYEGYEFTYAYDGERGLELIDRLRPDVLMLDLKLGAGIDGLEVLRRSKEIHPDMKVIVITGYLDMKLESEARFIGVDVYLEKPIDKPEELEGTIRNLVGRSESRGANP